MTSRLVRLIPNLLAAVVVVASFQRSRRQFPAWVCGGGGFPCVGDLGPRAAAAPSPEVDPAIGIGPLREVDNPLVTNV